MDSVQTLVWLSGTAVRRVLEHTDEEWLASIGRQVRAKKEREKKWLDKKKKEYDGWTKKYEDYLKWCEDNKKKPSALNHLTYKLRNKIGMRFPCMRSERRAIASATPALRREEDNKMTTGAKNSTEKANEPKQQEQAESPEVASGATSDKSKPSSSKSKESTSGKVKQDVIQAGGKPDPATEQPATNISTNEQVLKDEALQTPAQPTTDDAVTNTVGTAKDESNNAQDTEKTDSAEIKATPLTLEQEIEELKKQIAILTMKIGDGVKET